MSWFQHKAAPATFPTAHTAKTTGHKDGFNLRHTAPSINSSVWCWHTHLEVVVTFTGSSYDIAACITDCWKFEPRSQSDREKCIRSHIVYLNCIRPAVQSETNRRALKVLGGDRKWRPRTHYTREQTEKFTRAVHLNMLQSVTSTGNENNPVSSGFEGRK